MQITFSVTVEAEIHEGARRSAFEERKSLREWGGEAIKQRLERERKSLNEKLNMKLRGPKQK